MAVSHSSVVQGERSPERYAEPAAETANVYRDIATKLQNNEPLSAVERKIAAGVLCAKADALPAAAPKMRGGQRKIDPLSARLRWGWLCHHKGLSESKAARQVAEEYGVHENTIGRLLPKHRDWVKRQFAGLPRRTLSKRNRSLP